MKRTHAVGLGVLLAGLLAPVPTVAEPQAGSWSIDAGLGFTADPGSLLLALEADYHIAERLSVGPLLQIGFDDAFTLIAPSLNFRLGLGFAELGALEPFLQAGAGFTYIDLDRGAFRDDDDIGFLFNFGFGLEYHVAPQFSLGSRMFFNVLPGEVFGENFYYSWQVLGARFHF